MTFAETLCTLEACLLLDKENNFIGCDRDVDCLWGSLTNVVGAYDYKLLNDTLVLACGDKLKESPPVYLGAVKRERLTKLLNIWDTASGLWYVHIFQENVGHTCALSIRSYSVFELAHLLLYTGLWEV